MSFCVLCPLVFFKNLECGCSIRIAFILKKKKTVLNFDALTHSKYSEKGCRESRRKWINFSFWKKEKSQKEEKILNTVNKTGKLV